jgi:hypothetical protein
VAGMPQLAENCMQPLHGRQVPRDMPNAFGFGGFCYQTQNLGWEISAVSCKEMQGKNSKIFAVKYILEIAQNYYVRLTKYALILIKASLNTLFRRKMVGTGLEL